jgi:hypothetical protein
MRKIEAQMNAAIANGTNWTSGNTSVSMSGEVAEVRLHGNLIAEIGEGFITLFDGGFQSTTTKSRLNAILEANGLPGERVFAKAFNWFVQQEGGPVPFFSGMRLN